MPKRRYRTVCVCCGREGESAGRGLIQPCRDRHARAGTLFDFPRKTKYADDVLDAWYARMRNAPLGLTTAHVAKEIGISVQALQRAVLRARRRGDLRAVMVPQADPMTYRRFSEQYPV